MDKFSYTPDEVFNDTSAYSDPQSESEVREQLSRPHKQVETYINNTLIPAINKGNTDIQSQIDNTLTPAIEARMKTATYDADGNGIVDNAEKVNGHTVKSDVPENAKFTDTTYQQASETVTGLAKLYSGTGVNTDGSMTQEAVTDAISKAVFGDVPVDVIAQAVKSTVKTVTLIATSWSSGSYTITDSLITASSNQEVIPALDITADQLKALQKAMLVDGGQKAGSLTLKALGVVPTIDVPIRIIFRGVK